MADPYDRAAPRAGRMAEREPRRDRRIQRGCREARDILRYVAEILTPQLAGIAASELDATVADVSGERSSILAALDLLITGY
jgi:hypothetical protein